MATQADLRNAVLSRLGVADGAAAPEAEDAVRVEAEMRQVMAALHEDGLLPFDIDGVIPAAYVTPLSYLVAQELIADYGVVERERTILNAAERARIRLYRLKARPDFGLPTPAVYY